MTVDLSVAVFESFDSHVLVSCREKINELHQWMTELESEKFDHMERLKRQKYEVRLHLIVSL